MFSADNQHDYGTKCGSCGEVLNGDIRFCSHCGTARNAPASHDSDGTASATPQLCAERHCQKQPTYRCSTCGHAYCADHQYIRWIRNPLGEVQSHAREDLCLGCAATREEQWRRAKEDREADGFLRRESMISRMTAATDPFEKAALAIQLYGKRDTGSVNGVPIDHVRLDRPELVSILTALFPAWRASKPGPPWTGAQLSTWFAGRALAAGLPTNCTADWTVYHKGIRGKAKERVTREQAWRIPSGSNQSAGSSGGRQDAYVFPDGRFTPCEANRYPFPGVRYRLTEENLVLSALFVMLDLLGIDTTL